MRKIRPKRLFTNDVRKISDITSFKACFGRLVPLSTWWNNSSVDYFVSEKYLVLNRWTKWLNRKSYLEACFSNVYVFYQVKMIRKWFEITHFFIHSIQRNAIITELIVQTYRLRKSALVESSRNFPRSFGKTWNQCLDIFRYIMCMWVLSSNGNECSQSHSLVDKWKKKNRFNVSSQFSYEKNQTKKTLWIEEAMVNGSIIIID